MLYFTCIHPVPNKSTPDTVQMHLNFLVYHKHMISLGLANKLIYECMALCSTMVTKLVYFQDNFYFITANVAVNCKAFDMLGVKIHSNISSDEVEIVLKIYCFYDHCRTQWLRGRTSDS